MWLTGGVCCSAGLLRSSASVEEGQLCCYLAHGKVVVGQQELVVLVEFGSTTGSLPLIFLTVIIRISKKTTKLKRKNNHSVVIIVSLNNYTFMYFINNRNIFICT
ncbi:hypothetical protein ILYODFUR_039002 [Ilyodon furcidens]|uniref:Secreted protein n=1 Tax=Ilyodon furcidens TaxID=33524 RepID=A0ABV0VBH1_9TELE